MNAFILQNQVTNPITTKIEAENLDAFNNAFQKDSDMLTYKKKEKRNRKYFLKRSILLASISKSTGNIEFYSGSDFLHIEIMQGGHLPLNQYSLKEVKQETFSNDQDCLIENIENSLKLASVHLKKTIMEQARSYESPFYFSLLPQQQQIKNEKKIETTNNKTSIDCNFQQYSHHAFSQSIQALKKTLLKQYQDIRSILE